MVGNQMGELKKRIREMGDSLTISDVTTFPKHFRVMNFVPINNKIIRLLKIGPEVGCLMTDTSMCRCAYTYLKSVYGCHTITFRAWFACINDLKESLHEDATLTPDEAISIVAGAAKWAGIKRIFTGEISGTAPIESDGIRIIRCGGSETVYFPFLGAEEDCITSNHAFLGLEQNAVC